MALANYFKRATPDQTGNLLFVLPAVLVILIPVGLILKEPNLGTAVITASIGCTVMPGGGGALVVVRHRHRHHRRLGAGAVRASAYLPAAPASITFLQSRTAIRSAPGITSFS